MLGLTILIGSGCTRLYYAANEKIGREKRDILAARVEKGKKEQADAKEQFQNALQAFQAVSGFHGGKLEDVYNKLERELKRSEDRAKEVHDAVGSIDHVARDLFKEWEKEIASMNNRELRSRSGQMLSETEGRYGVLIRKMKASEAKMEPVLQVFRDQVLFLKHNLNARAIASLKDNAVKIDREVESLVKDIEASIAESDAFIKSLAE